MKRPLLSRARESAVALEGIRCLGVPTAIETLRDCAELMEALRMDQPWSLTSVLKRLADAADHLLDAHDCDAHGYEEVGAARDAARDILRRLDELP